MMVTPRTFIQAVPRRSKSTEFNEKGSYRSTRSPSNSPRTQSPLSVKLSRYREPSPTKSQSRTVKIQPQTPVRKDASATPAPTPIVESDTSRFRRESTKDLLSSTAIPMRRKPKGRTSQRLPRGDHVTNFSSLLMDDIKPSLTGAIPRSASSSNFEGLFGNMDELLEEGQMYIGSEGLDSGVLSTRSLSDDSLASLPSPDDYTTDDRHSQHSSISQPMIERRVPHLATSEDCTDDHPLSLLTDDDNYFDYPEIAVSPPDYKLLSGRSEKKAKTSFKSSLTASLKALKSAAQSVSNRTTSEDRARSFFDFHPGLTDDRRPPPSLDEPTPELRRYLNPPPLDAAAQLHFWQDYRHSKFEKPLLIEPKRRSQKGRKSSPNGRFRSLSPERPKPTVRDLPAVVQLASCLPPSVRTQNASSPPIWLTQDGTPVNKTTAIPLLYDPNGNTGKGEPAVGVRHREPRENRDFLRVFVCEMQMRRSGKLSEDLSAGRARLWLPPVSESSTNPKAALGKEGDVMVAAPDDTKEQEKRGRSRLVSLSVDDL